MDKNIFEPKMSNNLSLENVELLNRDAFTDMDGLIKLILAIILGGMPFLFENQMSFVILAVYLLTMTLASRMRYKTLLISATSYFIIVLIPYLFGYSINSLLYSVTHNEIFTYDQGPYQIFLRLVRLFIIWYVSILYFHTTPIKTVIGLLDKFMFPLKLIGVPVRDYLKVVMCIVIQLKGTGAEMKKNFMNRARSTIGARKGRFKINVRGISQIIVSLLVNSFEKVDEIQSFVENVKADDLYYYKFKISKRDIVVVLTFMLLIAVLYLSENG